MSEFPHQTEKLVSWLSCCDDQLVTVEVEYVISDCEAVDDTSSICSDMDGKKEYKKFKK